MNFCINFSNGFKIQYGRKEVSANVETEITMPTSFYSTSTYIAGHNTYATISQWTGGTSKHCYATEITAINKITTYILKSEPVSWWAIGY